MEEISGEEEMQVFFSFFFPTIDHVSLGQLVSCREETPPVEMTWPEKELTVGETTHLTSLVSLTLSSAGLLPPPPSRMK